MGNETPDVMVIGKHDATTPSDMPHRGKNCADDETIVPTSITITKAIFLAMSVVRYRSSEASTVALGEQKVTRSDCPPPCSVSVLCRRRSARQAFHVNV